MRALQGGYYARVLALYESLGPATGLRPLWFDYAFTLRDRTILCAPAG